MDSLLVISFLCMINGYFAARIVMLPMFGPSHYLVLAKLGEELDRRGHEVNIFVYEGAKYASGSLVKPFKTIDESAFNKQVKGGLVENDYSVVKELQGILSLQRMYCDSFLSDQNVLNVLKTTEIIIGDSFFMCSALVAAKFNIAHVSVLESPLGTPTVQMYGVSTYPSYAPQMLSSLSPNMGLLDRVKNFGYYISRFLLVEVYARGYYNEVKLKHNIKPEEDIMKTLLTVDLVLLERDLILDYAMPLPPYVKEVGSFMPCPPRTLKPEWEEFLASSGEHGVILVSFGSMLDTLDNNIVEMMNKAFASLPYKFIWRLNTDKFSGKIASNIKTVRWLPQNDLLGNPKVKLFIGHGGANGLAEAVYHGVPMICSPFSGDQYDNAVSVEYIGLGEILSVKTATSSQLENMIKKVLTVKRYKERALYLSKVVRLRPRTPVEDAAEHVEYLHAVGNLNHLKPKGLDLPLYKLYMLDVFLVLAVVCALMFFVLSYIFKKCCCGSSAKVKTS